MSGRERVRRYVRQVVEPLQQLSRLILGRSARGGAMRTSLEWYAHDSPSNHLSGDRCVRCQIATGSRWPGRSQAKGGIMSLSKCASALMLAGVLGGCHFNVSVAPSVHVTATPENVCPQSTVTVSWNSTGAASVNIDGIGNGLPT